MEKSWNFDTNPGERGRERETRIQRRTERETERNRVEQTDRLRENESERGRGGGKKRLTDRCTDRQPEK